MSAPGSSSHQPLPRESRTVSWPRLIPPAVTILDRPLPLSLMPGDTSSLTWWQHWRITTRGSRPLLSFGSTSSPTTSTRPPTASSLGGRLCFRDNVGKLKRTLLVLDWDDPKPLSRAWCLWEMVSTVDTKSEFHVLMSPGTTSRSPLPWWMISRMSFSRLAMWI